MLASIHPLGERSRHRRWGVTVSAYILGSTLAAATFGLLLGSVGRLVVPGHHAAAGALAAGLCALALAFELGVGGLRLPTVHRQVDKAWLDRYRGWVVGAGFGAQLGFGVVTIVDTAAVYLSFGLALLTGSAVAGAAVGAAFGLVRALVLLTVGGVHRPDQLRAALRRVHGWRPRWRRIGIAVDVAALVIIGAAAMSS